jgi:hypothetical protein
MAAAGGAIAVSTSLMPTPSTAQTAGSIPDPNASLLQPTLDGNPNNPPRFRRPGDTVTAANQAPPTGSFIAPSRIGATPVYGSPSGFGAGDTGFDSRNRSKRKKQQAQAQAAVAAAAASTTNQPETTFVAPPADQPPPPKPPAQPVAPPPAVVFPARAAARPGAVLPPPQQPPQPLPVSNPPPEVHPLAAANRPGAVTPVPPPIDADISASLPPPGTQPPNVLPLGTVPLQTIPGGPNDPYAALGIRAGSFLLLPSLDLSAAHDSNPQRIPGGGPSYYFVVAPELQAQSNWSRHSLTADIIGSWTEYTTDFTPSLNRPYFNSKIDGRIDVTRDTQILLENRALVTTDNPGSPNISAGLAKLPLLTTVGGTVGAEQGLGRFDVQLRGTIDRTTEAQSQLTDGESTSNADRDYNQYGGIFRVGYEIDPGFKPFVEVDADSRVHDEEFDRNGLQRDSTGVSGVVGATLNLFGTVTGEIGIGYLDRKYQDPTLPDVNGFIANGSVTWQATALTSAKLTAVSVVNESILAGVSAQFSRDVNIQVDHAFRRWLIGTLQVGYGQDDYVGSPRVDNRYFVLGGITYKLNREMQLRGQVREDWMTSSVSGVAYTATSFLLGLHLQR